MGQQRQQQPPPPPCWWLKDMAITSLFHTVSYFTNKAAFPRTLYLQLIPIFVTVCPMTPPQACELWENRNLGCLPGPCLAPTQ